MEHLGRGWSTTQFYGKYFNTRNSGPRNLNPLRMTHIVHVRFCEIFSFRAAHDVFSSPPVYISGRHALPKTNSSPLKMHLSKSKGLSPNPSFLRCLVSGRVYNLPKWCCGFWVFPLRLEKSEHVSKYSGNAVTARGFGMVKKRDPGNGKGHGWSNLLALKLPVCHCKDRFP